MNTKTSSAGKEATQETPSRLIDARIRELDDWRGQTLARVRDIIRQADPAGLFNASLDGNTRCA